MPPEKRSINPQLLEAAAAGNKARSDAIAQKLFAAMRKIDEEIEANEGIYPGGRITANEVCRRASVHIQTLHSPAHKDTTRRIIEEWLDKKKTRTVAKAKKIAVDRIDHWKAEHAKVASQIVIYELELQEKDNEIREMKAQVEALQAKVEAMAAGKVTSIVSSKKEK